MIYRNELMTQIQKDNKNHDINLIEPYIKAQKEFCNDPNKYINPKYENQLCLSDAKFNEFVEYYKNYGIDKIYLNDNNDIDGEHFEDEIQNFIDNGFVDIINWRGAKGGIIYYKIMDSCYQMHHNDYDWLIFYEIDEFLYLKDYNNVKNYLNRKVFNRCDSIRLNWVHISDNNKLIMLIKIN